MSLQNLIEERNKKFDEEFVYSDLEATSGQPAKKPWRPTHQLRDAETTALKQFHSNSINMIIEGVIKMVNEELEIQNKIQEKAKEIVVVGRQKVNEMLQDKYIRQGKIEALNNIISQLQTLKK